MGRVTKPHGVSFRTDDTRIEKLREIAEARHMEGPNELTRAVMEDLADNPDGLTDGERILREEVDQLRLDNGKLQQEMAALKKELQQQKKMLDGFELMGKRMWQETTRTSLMIETLCRLQMSKDDFERMEHDIDDPGLPADLWQHRAKMELVRNGTKS